MAENIIEQIGLEGLAIAYILIGALSLIVIILFIMAIVQSVQISKLKKKYMKFMQGKDAQSLENDIMRLYEDNHLLRNAAEKNKKDIRVLFHNMEFTFQKCGIVKYDAFSQMGGKLSFSLALLNERNDGFIINSVHSSDGCYSYTKEIKGGNSDISLGNEEKEALELAMKKK